MKVPSTSPSTSVDINVSEPRLLLFTSYAILGGVTVTKLAAIEPADRAPSCLMGRRAVCAPVSPLSGRNAVTTIEGSLERKAASTTGSLLNKQVYSAASARRPDHGGARIAQAQSKTVGRRHSSWLEGNMCRCTGYQNSFVRSGKRRPRWRVIVHRPIVLVHRPRRTAKR